ncbi:MULTISPECIES: hypothetical protein [unclassified Streptomyces]|uniref:hypothetical protein n=1 Tax=unclassified Streptomyces TaxID=2593676 RepID=UPI0036E2BFD5
MKRRRLLQSSAAAIGALSTTPLAAGGAAHAAAPGRARVAARAHPVTVKPVTGGEAAEVTHSSGTKVAAEAWSPYDADLLVASRIP